VTGYVLALDQGSQSSRAVVYSATGSILAISQVPVETRRYSGGRVEQSPQQIIDSLHQVIADVVEEVDADLITAAGLATQRSSIVCWQRSNGKALSPVLSWQDCRADEWLSQFSVQQQQVSDITGLLLSPHYGVSKIRWCLDNIEAVQLAHARNDLVIGPLSSYITYELLEEHPLLVDPANASRTLLFDLKTLGWSNELLNLFGIPESILPDTTDSGTNFGRLSYAGIDAPLQLVTGDQSAALFAFGDASSTIAYANLGTGAFVQRPVGDQPLKAPGLLSSVVYSDRSQSAFVLEGTVNGAGAAVNDIARELQLEMKQVKQSTEQWLVECKEPPLFLNGVSGLAAPWWIPDFESSFVGAGGSADRIVAVLESIVFMLQTNNEVASETVGVPESWLVTGGLSVLDGVCQRLADISGLPVVRPEHSEATAAGLAHLLIRNSGGAGSRHAEHLQDETIFQPQSNSELDDRYTRWRYAMAETINSMTG